MTVDRPLKAHAVQVVMSIATALCVLMTLQVVVPAQGFTQSTSTRTSAMGMHSIVKILPMRSTGYGQRIVPPFLKTGSLAASTTAADLGGDFGSSSSRNSGDRQKQRNPSALDGEAQDLQAIIGSTESPSVNNMAEQQKVPFPIVMWRFSRPHTLIGSALAIPALHLLAAPTSVGLKGILSLPVLNSILYAMIPSLLMNIYITGLNQITDVEIDKINKPNLVIPAGVLSRRNAIWTVVVCLVASLWMGTRPLMGTHPVLASPGLAFALWGSAILGTMYSLEPFRLKRFPLLAAFCIVAVRGTVINAGFFAHATTAAFQGSASVLELLRTDPKCLLSSLFFCVFGVVIALMKDVPDVLGDKTSNVRTLSVRIGQTRVFHASRRLLAGLFFAFGAGFVKGAVTAPSAALVACRGLSALASVAAGLSVRKESRSVDPENPKQVYQYYMHLWKLFYLSYLVLPFAR